MSFNSYHILYIRSSSETYRPNLLDNENHNNISYNKKKLWLALQLDIS